MTPTQVLMASTHKRALRQGGRARLVHNHMSTSSSRRGQSTVSRRQQTRATRQLSVSTAAADNIGHDSSFSTINISQRL